MMKAKILALVVVCAALAGCSTEASRMRECRDQGISRNTCYLAEQNRKAAINSAAEKQAMENAQSQWGNDNGGHHHKRHHDDDDY